MPDHTVSGSIERPASLPGGNALFGSDVVADVLRALEIPFVGSPADLSKTAR